MNKLKFLIVLILIANTVQAQYPAGNVVVDHLYSASLENDLGEDPTRRISVYLPPGYEETADRYPVIYYLHGFTWSDSLQIAVDQFDKLLDKAIAQGKIKPVIVVIPNHQTKYRGSWYTNSSLGGNWADFTAIDLVSHIDENYRTIAESNSRGIVGHSMGGYGAIKLGMLFPEVFSAVYALSPGALGGVGGTLDRLINQSDSYLIRLFEIRSREELITDPDNFFSNAIVAMGRTFTPNLDNPPFYADIPFFLKGERLVINESIWERWRVNSPYEMVDNYIESLKKLTALKLDWGRNDEYSTVESQMFSKKLEEMGIDHYAEEYLGDHVNKLWTDDGRALNSMLPFFDAYLIFEK